MSWVKAKPWPSLVLFSQYINGDLVREWFDHRTVYLKADANVFGPNNARINFGKGHKFVIYDPIMGGYVAKLETYELPVPDTVVVPSTGMTLYQKLALALVQAADYQGTLGKLKSGPSWSSVIPATPVFPTASSAPAPPSGFISTSMRIRMLVDLVFGPKFEPPVIPAHSISFARLCALEEYLGLTVEPPHYVMTSTPGMTPHVIMNPDNDQSKFRSMGHRYKLIAKRLVALGMISLETLNLWEGLS